MEMTEMRMMKFMKLSNPFNPASLAARTKGLALTSINGLAPRSLSSVELTRSPTNRRPTI